MRERITAILASLREMWGKASRKMRLVFLGCVAGVLLLALVLTLVLNHKTYVMLFNDLSNTENAQAIAVLNDAGITYKVDNGRLLVEARDEDNARLQLAVAGFANSGFTTYDLANSGGLTATQQDKDRNARYDLQNRLQKTIELFPEVGTAVVTISVPQKNLFVTQGDDSAPTASITIQKKAGGELTAEQVRGIVNIVKSSVSGLTEANISIVDERGDLKAMLDLNEDFNNKKLNLTEQVNRSLENHILKAVQPPYGSGHVNVVVMTSLNTDSRVAEQITYQPWDPDNPTNNPLDYAEYSRDKSGDGFSTAAGVAGAQDNVGTPQYAAQEAEAQGSDYYSSRDIYDFLVNSLREQIVKDGFTIEKASASILIDAGSLSDEDRSAIITMAANASGIARENITVQNMRFATPEVDNGPTTRDLTTVFIISGVGLLALCILLIIVLTAISRRRKAQEAAAAAQAEEANLVDLMNEAQEFEPISLVESSEQKLKLQIKDLAESDPEIVAQLIKTWLVSGS